MHNSNISTAESSPQMDSGYDSHNTTQIYSTRPPLFTIQRWPEAAAAATIIHAAQQTVRPWWQMAINNDNPPEELS